jgi:acyl-CoA hydrolase
MRQKGGDALEREREVTMRFLAEPTDITFGGKVHGGAVMKWIDQAGYACTVGWSGQYCVTVYVGGIRFYKPVLIGNVVEVHARLAYTGRTSMHIVVGASDRKARRHTKTTHCVIVFVAVDEQGTLSKSRVGRLTESCITQLSLASEDEDCLGGSGTFWSLTCPRATSLPSSARVMMTCQSCWSLPCTMGSASTSTRPSVIGRKKSVLLLTPTANCPLSSTAADAPTLAAVSTAVV